MTTPAKHTGVTTLAELENLVIAGDFSKLTEDQCTQYIKMFCEERGLDYKSNPIRFLWLNNKKVPYAMKDCTDQLRRINGISTRIMSEKYEGGLLTIHVEARDKYGRSDEDYGVVPWSEKVPPEIASNLKMKAVTKAKRRVTLSISGLGWLDETEVEDIPTEAKAIPQHRQPESGPQMTRVDAKDFCNKLVKAIQGEKTKEEKRLAWDFGAEQRAIVKETWPDIYRDMVDRIKEDAKELGA